MVHYKAQHEAHHQWLPVWGKCLYVCVWFDVFLDKLGHFKVEEEGITNRVNSFSFSFSSSLNLKFYMMIIFYCSSSKRLLFFFDIKMNECSRIHFQCSIILTSCFQIKILFGPVVGGEVDQWTTPCSHQNSEFLFPILTLQISWTQQWK